MSGSGLQQPFSAGGHSVNLAAISSALAAGPDPRRRWIASPSAGATYGLVAASRPSTLGTGSAFWATFAGPFVQAVLNWQLPRRKRA